MEAEEEVKSKLEGDSEGLKGESVKFEIVRSFIREGEREEVDRLEEGKIWKSLDWDRDSP